MSATISRDEWLAALAEAEKGPDLPTDPNLLSTRELSELLGCSLMQASRKGDLMVAAGKAERTTKLIKRSCDSKPRKVIAYRLKP